MSSSPYEHIYSNQHENNDTEDRKENTLFSKCCFCIPLETGCFVLGYTSLVLNFIISLFFFGTLAFLAIYTHGFQYLRTEITDDDEAIPDMDSMDSNKLMQIIIITVLNGSLNLAWFAMCIVLLAGLHKKQPGFIKVQVSIATIRIILSIVGLALYTGHTTNSSVFCTAEILLSTCFILLYHSYANQLKQEQLSEDPKLTKIVSNVIWKYPQNIDQLPLSEKREKY